MTMVDFIPFGRQQTTTPAYWRDYEAAPFSSLRREMGRLFDNSFQAPMYNRYGGYPTLASDWPKIEVKDVDNEVIVTAEVPGLTGKDIELFFDKGNAVLPADQNVSFDPITFFEGHTHGEGELHKLFGKPVHVSVDSIGRRVAGGLILDQTIRKVGEPPSTRRWTISRVGQDRYSGTLTEAVGPVTAQVVGARAEIEYSMRHGLKVEQQLAQQPDGESVLNRLTVHKLGVEVATLTETIRRVAP